MLILKGCLFDIFSKGRALICRRVLIQRKGIVNPLTPMTDQDRISPYNINTISSRQMMRIRKNIN